MAWGLGVIPGTLCRIPVSVPADAAETTSHTLGGAVAASDELPDSTAARVLDAANEAFVEGFQVVALASAGLAALSAIGVALFLRNVRGPAGETETPTEQRVPESLSTAP